MKNATSIIFHISFEIPLASQKTADRWPKSPTVSKCNSLNQRSERDRNIDYIYATWGLRRLKSPLTGLFVQQFVEASRKDASNFCISGALGGIQSSDVMTWYNISWYYIQQCNGISRTWTKLHKRYPISRPYVRATRSLLAPHCTMVTSGIASPRKGPAVTKGFPCHGVVA